MEGSKFPFSLSLLGGETTNVHSSVLNAVDSHLMEIASLRQAVLGDNGSGGSVLAFVRFPEDARSASACDGKGWADVRIRMSYEKLIGLGSTKILDMFTPGAQRRFRRRLGLETLPPGIEYVVDFTPPAEGPELADLIAALWLPRMVKLWFLAGRYIPGSILERKDHIFVRPLADRSVGPIMTLGHDDVCKNKSCITDLSQWQADESVPGIFEESLAYGANHIPEFRKVEDYCPIRHRVSIVRLLRAINGDSLHLNSAVRMWTIAQVAIYLEVPQVVVDPVTQWLVAPPNTKFIEICPEKAFQLAYALKIPSVLIAAFKILVNERAIDCAASLPSPRLSEWTWNQRRRDEYGDFPSDPVDYASRAYAERMGDMLKMLHSNQVFHWLPDKIPQWEKLAHLGSLISSLGQCPLKEAYENLTAALLDAFRDHVGDCMTKFPGVIIELIMAQRKHYVPDWDRHDIRELYGHLNPFQKVITPFYWECLKSFFPSYGQFVIKRHKLPSGEEKSLDQLAMSFNWQLQIALSKGTLVLDPSPGGPDGSPSSPEAEHAAYGTDWAFNLTAFHEALKVSVRAFCNRVSGPHLRGGGDGSSPGERDGGGIPYFLSDHLLLSLEEPELNYLPLWAGGLDDGSGGVFQDPIPPAEMGPSEPGPGYHTGLTLPSVVGRDGGGDGVDGDDAEMVALGMGVLALEDDDETLARSVDAHRSGTATTVAGGAAGGGGGGSGARPPAPLSESFTADYSEDGGAGAGSGAGAGGGGGDVYAEARFAEPAEHQVQGLAIESYVQEAEEEDEAGMGILGEDDDMLDLGDDFSDDGSSTLDGFEEI